jgi:cellulose synthase/poly-beta-1,6-N-acetylglucosamine synthase-like glycosyltransferase/spore germination protein YaaH/peptidoglycan/xylan/chitin deacetylase (PgdA/CDA1 family)
MIEKRQIFQAESPARWKSVLWISRVIAVVLVLGIIALALSLFRKEYFKIPDFSAQIANYTKLSKAEIRSSLKDSDRKKFQKSLDEIRAKNKRDFYTDKDETPSLVSPYFPVRAGFYVNWDNQSYYSLRNNIDKLNMVLPEWFFVNDHSSKLSVEIDSRILNMLRKNKIAIIPMISNFYNHHWNAKNVHQIITSPSKRTEFINSIVEALKKYQFQGVNVDFEDLEETTDEYLIQFQRELYARLHKLGYIVTQDVAPFNPDYNYQELGKNNDLIFLMAYDQHNMQSLPGPIAENAWIERAMDELYKSISNKKVVLCLGAYGYDWAVGYRGEDVSFQEAINKAITNNSKIVFDNNSYNLSYSYTDDNKLTHQVYFTDAASTFNTMRIAEDFGAAGVALWRLGSEDSRTWYFFRRSLHIDSLKVHPFNFSVLEDIHSGYNVDFLGNGEVLDILSAPHPGLAELEINKGEQLIAEEKFKSFPSSFIIKRTGEAVKKIALTFDDGPDEKYTPKILSILKKQKINATFFVTGVNSESNLPLLKRIYDEGNEIGDHTFSHPNIEITSAERVRLELRLTRILIECITGHSTILFRPPYNTDAEPRDPDEIYPLVTAKDENFLCISASIDPSDWKKGTPADSIVAHVINQNRLGNIILLHDAGGDRTETVKALPKIIEYYQKNGYQFVTISELMGKKRADVMPAVTNNLEAYTNAADTTIFKFTYFYEQFLYGLFFLALLLILTRILSIAVFAILSHRKLIRSTRPLLTSYPMVSIIVPAYNEEITATRTVGNLLNCDYPNFEIVFIDDGSKDKTLENVKRVYGNHPKVKVTTKPNGGKASALNYGIEQANGEFLVCIDADTLLLPDAIGKMISYFDKEEVAAVAGNVKVGNKVNMLTNWQSIEYTTSQNFDRLAFDYINAIMVVPGAIGAFRKSALLEAGAFTTDTLAEDCDLTLRLLRLGYRVHTCNEAVSLTEAPETLKMFLKQRFRWSFGIMQSFWKHRDILFSRTKPNMGWILLPNVLIFQLILPLFSPIVDIMTLFALFTANAPEVLIAYFVFFIVDCIIASIAFHYDGQKFSPKMVAYMFVQRIVYRQFLFYVLIKSYIKALKGELANWGVLKRTGNVQQPE